MLIWVDDNLDILKNELLKKGYGIASKEEKCLCDVVISDVKNGQVFNLNGNINIKKDSALIIDSSYKTIDEIENIISNRSYF